MCFPCFFVLIYDYFSAVTISFTRNGTQLGHAVENAIMISDSRLEDRIKLPTNNKFDNDFNLDRPPAENYSSTRCSRHVATYGLRFAMKPIWKQSCWKVLKRPRTEESISRVLRWKFQRNARFRSNQWSRTTVLLTRSPSKRPKWDSEASPNISISASTPFQFQVLRSLSSPSIHPVYVYSLYPHCLVASITPSCQFISSLLHIPCFQGLQQTLLPFSYKKKKEKTERKRRRETGKFHSARIYATIVRRALPLKALRNIFSAFMESDIY